MDPNRDQFPSSVLLRFAEEPVWRYICMILRARKTELKASLVTERDMDRIRMLQLGIQESTYTLGLLDSLLEEAYEREQAALEELRDGNDE